MEKTLLLGNGFSMSIFEEIPSWTELISSTITDVTNYPILYEIELHRSKKNESEFKKQISQKIMKLKIKNEVNNFDSISAFGKMLNSRGINNILTTNYEDGIAYVLLNKCGYVESGYDNSENIYSIHRYTEYFNDSTGHRIKIWKIHGDIKKYETIQLGLNQYGEFLSKIQDYVNGKYKFKYNKKTVQYESIENRVKEGPLDVNSWIDLFFSTELYIAGFGMDYSEIDIWWLLTKRLRIKKSNECINNSITYIFSEKNGNAMEASIENGLRLLGVLIKKVNRTDDFISDTMRMIP